MKGIIIKALSGFYYISYQNRIIECRARGSFRNKGDSPLVGDNVEFEVVDDIHGVVDTILERKNKLSRPAVANIDKLFIVSSFITPAPNAGVIDRLTAIAVYNGIEPIIVFNKSDMGDFSKWQQLYKHAGFKTYIVSASTGEGLEDIKPELYNCISAFTGNSGVGKSSILNAVIDGLTLETGEISHKLGRGRHTTRHTELIPVKNGGYVADTPGFSSVENDISDYEFKEKLAECFPDFEKYIGNCKFSSCTHTCEKGCSVIEAVKNGEIELSRHQSYCDIFNELKELKPWQTNKSKNR